ncbi:MAG: DUF2182 domain-containing protein [Rhodospirillales bacterium]
MAETAFIHSSGPPGSGRFGARALMLCALALVAGLAWALMLWMPDAPEAAPESAAGGVMGGVMGGAMLTAMWVVMMFAMMLPTAAPAVLAYQDIAHAARAKGERGASALVFAAGYMTVWSLFGAALAGAQIALGVFTGVFTGAASMNTALSPAWAGALLIAAGLYQLTPQKDICLRACRSPLAFFIRHWREGRLGALRLGARHGVFCVGCCWMLMLLMFAGGTMNVLCMAALTLVMGAEKLFSGAWASRILALACICAGAALLAAAGQGG